MRIVAGEFRGRRLKPPPLPARATEERVREAWFNIVGSEVPAADVLDLFAGSVVFGGHFAHFPQNDFTHPLGGKTFGGSDSQLVLSG